MSKIKMVELDDAKGATKDLYDASTAMIGRVPHSVRVLGNIPMVSKFFLLFSAVMQREGAGSYLSSKIKEIVIIKTSQVNGCDYWLAHNTALGQAAGITDEQVSSIVSDDYMDSSILSDREKAAVLWAEHVTKNTARSRDDVFEVVKKSFSDNEIVELTLMCGTFNLWNRFMDSLGIQVEDQSEVDKIKKSVYLSPDKVKAFLETMLENWPTEFPVPDSSAPKE